MQFIYPPRDSNPKPQSIKPEFPSVPLVPLLAQWVPFPFVWFKVPLKRNQPKTRRAYCDMATGLPRY